MFWASARSMKSETGQRTAGMQVQTGKHAGAFEGQLVRSDLGRLPGADQVIEVGWLLVLATHWGGSYSLIKVAVETVPPLCIVAARASIAAVVLLLLARHQRL